MGTSMIPKLTTFVMFLTLARVSTSQPFIRPPPLPPRPLCASQFALVNHACETIPYTPVPPPSPPPSPPAPTPPDDDENRHNHHGHRRPHGHHHRHRSHHATPVESDCCRWLKEVDNECVCDLLVRLPAFLARPAHNYTVAVGDACEYTYECAGRLIRA